MQRPSLLFGLLAAGAVGAGASPPTTKRVAGRVVMVSSICGGGAAVTREQIEGLPPPRPIAGKEFLVVAGERISASQPAARFVTRADGTFVTRLPPGTWCFFEAGRQPVEPRDQSGEPVPRARVRSAGVDLGCLEEAKLHCDLVLAVKSDVSHARIAFPERCPEVWNQPCYRGPMPP